MRLAKYVQNVDENKQYAVDYSQWLAAGETLTGMTFLVNNVTTPALVVTNQTRLNANTGIVFFVGGGVAGQRYIVTIEVTTSLGQIKADKIYYVVTT